MPIHDWTRVNAGIFHDFHLGWVVKLVAALNNGGLPDTYYAITADRVEIPFIVSRSRLLMHPAKKSPRCRWTNVAEEDAYAEKRISIEIRHTSDDRMIALIEIVSPGTKSSKFAITTFMKKVGDSFAHGYHLLIIDLFPPGPRDPNGIHGAIWSEFVDDSYRQPTDEPLTLVAYSAGSTKTAYIEPTAVGKELIPMPLFLEPEGYVEVPLEETYQRAYRGVPQRWKRVIEGEIG